jgi:hypothetical protein
MIKLAEEIKLRRGSEGFYFLYVIPLKRLYKARTWITLPRSNGQLHNYKFIDLLAKI